MSKSALNIAVLFVILLLVQVLICNHIVLFGVAVPFVFIYFIIKMPVDMSTSLLLTLSFLLGLGVDICSDTAGMNALASTLLAMMKRKLFFSYVLRDDQSETLVPSIVSMGIGSFFRYLVTAVAIYCLMIFSIEYFSISDVKEVFIKAAASTVLTTLLLFAVDGLSSARREKRL